ncbi:glycosyltransferase [Oceanobacillus senegalensis]|uniref:glycosyltransferase n=1 Tax=Oceanobacillus senegalensis TaxID=1936063 RepID=UPI001FE4CBAE|nr:glycosyltransferase [Oceanobacillus senegalensis]
MSKHQKKILVITNMYPSKKNKSFGIFVKNQVVALRKKGLNVNVAAIKDQRMGKVHVLKKYLKWVLQIMFHLIFKGARYDTVHVHYVFPGGLFGLLFKKLFKTQLIVTAHGGDIDKMARKGPFFFNQTKKILQKADYVIAVGEKLKQDIIHDFSIPEEKIQIINMGVNRTVFKPMDKKQAKKELHLSLDAFHILFVGNKIKAKGLYELVKAYQILKEKYPHLQLHIIGANKEPGFLQEVEEEISTNRIEDVHFYPAKTQKEIARWMSAADTFVLPSYMEGFGLVAVEAMSCQTPVVGSNVGGLARLLHNGSGMLVEPQDIDSLKTGLEEVITNHELRQSMIKSGEEKANENDEVKQIEKLLAVYGMMGARQ